MAPTLDVPVLFLPLEKLKEKSGTIYNVYTVFSRHFFMRKMQDSNIC